MRNLFLLLMLVSVSLYGAGTVTVTRSTKAFGKGSVQKHVEVVNIDWVADASAATIPTTNVALYGYVSKIITNPGTTAPTANYDIAFGDPEDTALDALASALQNRHTTTTEQVYPLIAGSPGTVSAVPVFLAGTYAVSVSNNAVNSASGRIQVYLVDSF